MEGSLAPRGKQGSGWFCGPLSAEPRSHLPGPRGSGRAVAAAGRAPLLALEATPPCTLFCLLWDLRGGSCLQLGKRHSLGGFPPS